ncbi:MAG TPA: hypothetical protein VMI53_14685 [Opitutaceae bacterium]|nr:hypothetical protein [Opitutaceae bacterium]
MKLKQHVLFALAAFSAAGVVYAQENMAGGPATDSSAGGVIGQRYADLNFGLQHIKHVSDNAYGIGAAMNVPVESYMDATVGYGYSWINSTLDERAHVASFTDTIYTTLAGGAKPFLSAGVGYEWDRISGPNFKTDTAEFGLWGLDVGIEVPTAVQGLSVTPAISYLDDFRKSRNSAQARDYGVEANYWVDAKWSVYGNISYQDVLHSGADSWNYTAGIRIKF